MLRCCDTKVSVRVCADVCKFNLLAPVLLQEATILEDCVHFLVSRCRMAPGQLGVITPYAAQGSLLCRRLQQRGYNINGSGGGGSWGDPQDGEAATAATTTAHRQVPSFSPTLLAASERLCTLSEVGQPARHTVLLGLPQVVPGRSCTAGCPGCLLPAPMYLWATHVCLLVLLLLCAHVYLIHTGTCPLTWR